MARFEGGWIKAWRKAAGSDLVDNVFLWGLWHWLLYAATRFPEKKLLNGKQRELAPGTVVFGLKEIADKWGCSRGTVSKWLNYLAETGRISVEACTRGCIVTILNWDVYQGSEESACTPREHGVNAARTPREHEVAHNGEFKNSRMGEEGKGASPNAPQPPALNPITSEDVKLCSETWKETLRHFKTARSLLAEEEFQIARSIQRWGKTAVLLALEGARHEPRDEKFDPSKYLRLSRYLDQENFQRFLNLGTQARHKAGSA